MEGNPLSYDESGSFSKIIKPNEKGSEPTGLYFNIPNVGEIQIILVYSISGNIDNLFLSIGVDFSTVVLGHTVTCSSTSNECPTTVFAETINYASFC